MNLDCLVVVHDSNLLRVLTSSLEQAGIDAKVCSGAEEAMARLQDVKFDSVMVDCVELEEGPDVLRCVRRAPANRKSIVFAIVDDNTSVQERADMGANFVLERPIQPDLLNRSLRAARSIMVQEHRRYFRYKVDISTSLILGNNEKRVTATNISTGGMSVQSDKPLQLGWTGTVEFYVKEVELKIEAKGEIVWLSGDNTAGVRFTKIPLRLQKPFEEWLGRKADEDGLDVARRRHSSSS
jgi:DNA-binding response OmpR family regulator